MTGHRDERTAPPAGNPEGDPRERDGQDRRAAGARDDARPKDDPSRAPESGTP